MKQDIQEIVHLAGLNGYARYKKAPGSALWYEDIKPLEECVVFLRWVSRNDEEAKEFDTNKKILIGLPSPDFDPAAHGFHEAKIKEYPALPREYGLPFNIEFGGESHEPAIGHLRDLLDIILDDSWQGIRPYQYLVIRAKR